MNIRWTTLACALAMSALLSGSAGAQQVVAGWDFSQLGADGVAPGVLSANYGSGVSGTATVAGGDVVASALPPGSGAVGAAGVQGNVDGTALALGDDSFNNFAGLATAGQANTEYLGLTARSSASIEFDASNGGTPLEFWQVSFGGLAIPRPSSGSSDGVATVDVSFGTTCGATTPIGSVALSAADSGVSLNLGSAVGGQTTGCVVFDLDGTSDQPLIDNVALTAFPVPEPGSFAMLTAGVLGLLGLARRRQA